MPEVISSMSVFQTIIVLFGAGGFCTAGGVIFSFGKNAQKVHDLGKDLEEGNKRFSEIEKTLVKHGKLLARIDERTENILKKEAM